MDAWAHLALKNNVTIGCPSIMDGSPIAELELLAEKHDQCGKEAKLYMLTFYPLVLGHGNYAMCGLLKKEQLFISKIAPDGGICSNEPVQNLQSCFLNVLSIVKSLKNEGHLKEAFELAKKIANSNDVTGVSQLVVGIMYDFGEGTDKNPALAIKWLKVALEKLMDRSMRIDALISLVATNEEVKNYKQAKYYARQCASLGNKSCETAFKRLEELGARSKGISQFVPIKNKNQQIMIEKMKKK